MIASIEKKSAVVAILHHLGLADAPLPMAKSRGPPEQTCFAW